MCCPPVTCSLSLCVYPLVLWVLSYTPSQLQIMENYRCEKMVKLKVSGVTRANVNCDSHAGNQVFH